MYLLRLALSVHILVTCQPIWAMSCANVFFNDHEQVQAVSFLNFRGKSRSLNGYLRASLEQNYPETLTAYPELLNATHEILEHAIHNTVQHSSHEFARSQFSNTATDNSKTNVIVKMVIRTEASHTYVEIINPQIKPFPKSLRQEFFNDEQAEVPGSERFGARGNGFALGYIFSNMRLLPEGSTVKWDSDGDKVIFTLKIKHVR